MSQNYDINHDDKRFAEVEADKKAALNEADVTYGNMISNSDKYYQSQIDASKQWAEKQSQLQQEQTDFAIEKIEQEKAQAKKDYTKEQSGAYVDWQKQSDPYGANAERVASAGLAGSGYSESSQVSMYNTYQNRITAARESYNQAVLGYNNAITEARLQNNSILAEIAYTTLQQQLELSLQGFQYKNQLIIEKSNKKTQLNSEYYARYQDVLKQINTENALAEEVRQYNATLSHQQAQLAEQKRQFNAQLAEEQRQFNATHSGSSGGGSGASIKKGSSGNSSSKAYKEAKDEHIAQKKYQQSQQPTASAYDYLNKLIASGASKDKVANEISLALRNGAITKAQATALRKTFTPRGYTY
jgi:hypothetical protein